MSLRAASMQDWLGRGTPFAPPSSSIAPWTS